MTALLPLILAASIAPVGRAAMAEPGRDLDSSVGGFDRLVGQTVPVYQASGRLRHDAEAYETADLLRISMNSVLFGGHSSLTTEAVGLIKKQANADAKQTRTDSETPSYYADIDWRADDATVGGSILARQIEAQWATPLEMPKPKLQGLELFAVNTDAPPGSENIRITRFLDRGQAAIFNGGQIPVPPTAFRQVSTHVPFRYLVSGAKWSIFDQLSWNLARLNGVARQLATARLAIEQLHDQIIWTGAEDHQIYGIINYPWLSRRTVLTPFSATADVDVMVREIVSLFTSPSETSNNAYQPDRIMMGSKLWNFLASKRLGTYNDSSLLDYLQKQIKVIADGQGIEVKFYSIPRLNDIKGTGVHGVFVCSSDREAVSVLVSQPTTMMPLQTTGFDMQQVCYKAVGGVTMPNVGANLMGYVTLS